MFITGISGNVLGKIPSEVLFRHRETFYKVIKQDCPYEMYLHGTRSDSAKLASAKSFRPAMDLDGI